MPIMFSHVLFQFSILTVCLNFCAKCQITTLVNLLTKVRGKCWSLTDVLASTSKFVFFFNSKHHQVSFHLETEVILQKYKRKYLSQNSGDHCWTWVDVVNDTPGAVLYSRPRSYILSVSWIRTRHRRKDLLSTSKYNCDDLKVPLTIQFCGLICCQILGS